ncbi:class IV adenylate cyclase [Methanobacterium aggregans]|uniref:class IV adenylate cyclase n=1 Tax=Methanobacterium aggregans TaxID=1615586 RepID=UPI001AE1D53B|nr:class IV adenylate cyclase [Methanobacterium aggregans]MBP2045431.1 adenylate cyclase class 2 [Methanobacterium aggregans]
MIEVEVKAHAGNFNDVEVKLNEIRAEMIGLEHQKDVYFNAPDRDFAETDEALRIREIPDTSGKRIILTYKGAKMDEVSKTRKEIEVDVSDTENMASILENLGFRAAATVEKKRIIYKFKESIISLDEVLNVGKFIEIEREAREGEDFSQARDEIFELFKKLGIEDGFERRSYLELMGVH